MSDLVQKSTRRLHHQGGRMTAQRRVILETLEHLDSHPTAEELHDIVSDTYPSIHLSTVYRTLRWLEQEGLVRTRRFVDDFKRDRFDPASSTEHHHFLCTACKKVIEFDDPEINMIKARFIEKTGEEVIASTVILYGFCTICCQDHLIEE